MPPLNCVRPQCYKTKKVPNRCMAPNPWVMWLRDNGGQGKTMQELKDTYYPWRDDNYQGLPANNKVGRQNKMCDIVAAGGPAAFIEFNQQQINNAINAANQATDAANARAYNCPITGYERSRPPYCARYPAYCI